MKFLSQEYVTILRMQKMSKEDAPNYRLLEIDSCFNCRHNEYIALILRCIKHDFYLYMHNNAICDSWEIIDE
jgi:glucose-6-phosphate 1-dehydrogenase